MNIANENFSENKPAVNFSDKYTAKFYSKFSKSDGCWVWNGATDKNGYGCFCYHGEKKRAPRISWVIHHGAIPDGLIVLHKCDNPPCVNPDHLYLGTWKDNMQDRISKGRANMPSGDNHHSRRCRENMKRGEAHKNSRLTTEKVIQIREIYSQKNMSQLNIAKMFGVSQASVWNIVKRITWVHV